LTIKQKDAPKKVMKKLVKLTPSSGQTVQPFNSSWGIFRKLISLAVHWRIKFY